MRQPLVLFLTDTHLVHDTISVNYHVFSQAVKLCHDHGIKVIVLGGDIFTSRAAQPESALTAFSNILDFIHEADLSLVCITGNHDKTDLRSEDSFLNPYVGRAGLVLYRSTGQLHIAEHNLRLHFLPYFDEKLSYENYLDQVLLNVTVDDLNILFTHVAISGVKNNDGTIVSNNLTPHNFRHFHKVLVGHYHNRQIFDNIYYTGSAYQANFGEDEHKGVTILYSDGSVEFISLDLPRYRTYDVLRRDLPQLCERITDGESYGDHLRVRLKFKPEPKEASMLNELIKLGVKVIASYEEESTLDKVHEVKTSFDKADILAYFDEWCDEQGIEDREFGLKQLQA